MKKISFLILFLTTLAACTKPDNDKPDDKTKYDNSNLGVYKGVLIGSTGYITIELKSTGANATVIFDGVTYLLSSNASIQAGTKITGYVMQKDGVKITMDVNADGSIPNVAVEIPGHDVTAAIFKVTSAFAVENYIGTFRNVNNSYPQFETAGIFNFSVKANDVQILSKCQTGDCDNETGTDAGKITTTTNGFTINLNNCNTAEKICSLKFVKTTGNNYKFEDVTGGIGIIIEVTKVE